MHILSIKNSLNGDALHVSLSDGTVVTVPWPTTTWHREPIQKFLDAGGVIQPADPPPPPIDLSDVDNLEKAVKALGLVVAQWNGKTVPQLKSAFKAAWESLP